MKAKHWLSSATPTLGKFLVERRGSVAVLSALLLPLMIAMVSLVYEFGSGLLTQAQYQRIADAAAFAGALAYNQTSSTTSMTSAAERIATLNGISTSDLTTNLASSPSGDGNEAVEVKVASTEMLLLAPVLRISTNSAVTTSLNVSSSSAVEMAAQATGCIMALSGSGTGVTLSGGASVTAQSCTVSSNSTVSVPCGTTLTTQKVSYDSTTAPSEPCSGIVAPSGKTLSIVKAAVTNPLSSNSGVTSGASTLTTVEAMSNPSASGGSLADFASYLGHTPTLPSGCTTSQTSSPYTVVCVSGGTYNFAEIEVDGGSTVTIENTGTSINTYKIAAGTSGSCSGDYSICDTGTSLTFEGPSNFILPGGVYVGGGSTLNLASKTTSGSAISDDSFELGYGSSTSGDYAIYVGSGSNLIFGNAEGSSDVFTVHGNIVTSGGSCLWLPAAAAHEIDGYISGAGGVSLGDDSLENNLYSVADYVWFGANGGGDVSCNGETIGVQAVNVSMFLGGESVPTSGTCSKDVFCVAAGYGEVTWTAPTTGAYADLAVVGPASTSVTAGAAFVEGSSGTSITGAFYIPNGPITLTGAGSVSSTGCFEFIGAQITLSGGSNAASACSGLSNASGAEVTLVQ